MIAPYAKKLNEQLAATTDIGKRGEFTAHLACYYARSGELEASTELCRQLRQDFGSAQYPRVSILIMCLEAIQLYFSEQSPVSQDRIKRAHLLSQALGDRELIGFTAAWKAYFHFNFDGYVDMGPALQQAQDHIDEAQLPARLRMAIVLADSAIMTRQFPQARKWYRIARDLAVALGDQAAMGAITYNKAAFGVYTARVMRALGTLMDDEYQFLKTEVESAVNYQAIARLRSLDHLLGVAKSGILMLLDQHREALREIDSLLDNVDLKLTPNDRAVLRFDRVIAAGPIDRRAAAIQLLSAADYRSAFDASDAGDRVIILSQAVSILGDLDQVLPEYDYMQKLLRAREEYQGKMADLKASIQAFL